MDVRDAEAGGDADAPGRDGAACAATLSPDLRSALSRIAATTRGCYERLLRVDASIGGKIVVSVSLEPDGGSRIAIVSDTGLGPDLEQCVLDAFTRASLAGFAPNDDCVTIAVPITYTPRP
jgi:hypothetical protein